MPVAQIPGVISPWGLPVGTGAGLNQVLCFEAVNNSGTFMRHGDVVCIDTFTALNTTTQVLVSANATLTTTTQTITAGASTASYPAQGALLIPITFTGTAGQNTIPAFVAYGSVSGSTFLTAFSNIASVTNGMQANASIYAQPTALYSPTAGAGNTNAIFPGMVLNTVQQIGQPAAPSDGGRYVTLSTTAAVSNPKAVGVVTLDGTAATELGSNFTPAFTSGGVAPGNTVMVAVAGVARMQINATTVTAGNLMSSDATPGGGQNATQGTLGNMLGVALEANAAKDANNTVRVAMKIG